MVDSIKQLLKFNSLIKALVVRHLSVRYRGSFLGFLWSFLNPLMLMLVYSLVFRYYIRFDHVENYTIFLFCGLLPWLWVVSSLEEGTRSISGSGHLITKSMFPAHILPAVSVLTSMIHFVLAIPLLFIFMLIAGMPIYWTWFLLPFVVALQAVFLYGLVLGLSTLNVYFRDVQHMTSNVLTLLFFLAPILYPADSVPEKFRFTLTLNPFAVFIELYHHILLDGIVPSLGMVTYASLWTLIFLVAGFVIYDRNRERFAEVL